jgi:hypothetical protein
VKQIENAETDGSDRPNKPIQMIRVTVQS